MGRGKAGQEDNPRCGVPGRRRRVPALPMTCCHTACSQVHSLITAIFPVVPLPLTHTSTHHKLPPLPLTGVPSPHRPISPPLRCASPRRGELRADAALLVCHCGDTDRWQLPFSLSIQYRMLGGNTSPARPCHEGKCPGQVTNDN